MIYPRGNPTGLPIYGKQGFTGENPLRIKVEAEGVQATIKFLHAYKANLYKLFPAAYTAGAKELHNASLFLCPIDKGVLSGTSKVDYVGGGSSIQAFVSYPDPKAMYVHEDLEKAHGAIFNVKYANEIARGEEHERRPQEQAKFLEVPARSTIVRHRIVAAILRVLQRIRK